jgi:hypothetical protein
MPRSRIRSQVTIIEPSNVIDFSPLRRYANVRCLSPPANEILDRQRSFANPAYPLTASRSRHLHIRAVSLQHADDDVILPRAAAEDRIVVSADTDFGALLAASSARKPSVIHWTLQ